jgi:hypothetical protein
MCGSRLVAVVFVRHHVVVVFARRCAPVIFVRRCVAVALRCGLRIVLCGGCLLCSVAWCCTGIVFAQHCAGVVFVWYCIGVAWGGCHLRAALCGGRLYVALHHMAGVFVWCCIAQASSSCGIARCCAVLSSRGVLRLLSLRGIVWRHLRIAQGLSLHGQSSRAITWLLSSRHHCCRGIVICVVMVIVAAWSLRGKGTYLPVPPQTVGAVQGQGVKGAMAMPHASAQTLFAHKRGGAKGGGSCAEEGRKGGGSPAPA